MEATGGIRLIFASQIAHNIKQSDKKALELRWFFPNPPNLDRLKPENTHYLDMAHGVTLGSWTDCEDLKMNIIGGIQVTLVPTLQYGVAAKALQNRRRSL